MSDAIWKLAQSVGFDDYELRPMLEAFVSALTQATASEASLDTEGVPVAWRDLAEGEVIQAGDRLLSGGKEWAVLEPGSHAIGKEFWWLDTYPVQRVDTRTAQPAPAAPAVPAGWQLVPVEPTPEMLEALATSLHASHRKPDGYRAMLSAAPAAAVPAVPEVSALLDWAVSRWADEVKHRPLVNKNRRTLDDAWRQVVRFAGGDPDVLLGACHDDLIASAPTSTASKQDLPCRGCDSDCLSFPDCQQTGDASDGCGESPDGSSDG
jgi:hypothetical protein